MRSFKKIKVGGKVFYWCEDPRRYIKGKVNWVRVKVFDSFQKKKLAEITLETYPFADPIPVSTFSVKTLIETSVLNNRP